MIAIRSNITVLLVTIALWSFTTFSTNVAADVVDDKNGSNTKGIRGSTNGDAGDVVVEKRRRTLQDAIPIAALPQLGSSSPPPPPASTTAEAVAALDGRLNCVPVAATTGEYEVGGGAVTCTFDAMLPAETDTTKCMDSEEIGGQICLTFNPTKLPPDLPPPSPPSAGGVVKYPIGTHDGQSVYDMKCPRDAPQSGTSCGGWCEC